jgi:hypothetical protein
MAEKVCGTRFHDAFLKNRFDGTSSRIPYPGRLPFELLGACWRFQNVSLQKNATNYAES